MKTYNVTIRATVTKTIRVENAESEQQAIEQAHRLFTTLCDGADEDYNETLMDVEELT